MSPNVTDRGKMVALHSAACFGHEQVVSYLLSLSHTNVNAADRWGFTALHEACRKDHDVIVKMLLEHNAVPMKNAKGQLPWQLSKPDSACQALFSAQ
eukprot:m.103021 g.103021  ORF g.103021 m.103021 type:complete len:97 (-) comp12605_c1_seq4:3159-3449(-)